LKVNAQIKQFLDRVGKDMALKIIPFYLANNRKFYQDTAHGVGPMLQDCEALATQVSSGTLINTAGTAKNERFQILKYEEEQMLRYFDEKDIKEKSRAKEKEIRFN
jgi:hypothetical protein